MFIWGLASLFFLYEFFLQVFLSTISHDLMHDLNLDASSYSIMGAGYFLSYSLMQIPVGILTDRFGPRLLLPMAAGVATLGVFWFCTSHSFSAGFTSRFLMGFGSSFAYVSLLVLALNWFPKKHFALMIGLANLLGATGPFLAGGPLSYILSLFNNEWRAVLFAIGVFGTVLCIMIALFVRNGPSRDKKAIIHLDPFKEKLSKRLKTMVKNPQAWFVVLSSGTIYVSLPLLGAYWGTSYLQARGLTQTVAASISSFLWIGYAVGAPLTGKISDAMHRRLPVLSFCSVVGLIVSALIVYLPETSVMVFSLLFFLIGFASSGSSVGFALISEHVQPNLQATSLGFNNSMATFIGGLFPIVVGFLIERGTSDGVHHYSVSQYQNGLILMPIFYGISLLLFLFFIKETFCRSQHGVVKVQRF